MILFVREEWNASQVGNAPEAAWFHLGLEKNMHGGEHRMEDGRTQALFP